MPTLSEDIISPAILDQAVDQTFSLLVGMQAVPVDAPSRYAADDLSLAVFCDVDQQSVVLVRCSRALASTFAERMLDLSASDVQECDLLDAAGEVVNVIAGTLRGVLPRIGTMSPPFQVPSGDLDYLSLSERHYQIDGEGFHLSTAFNY